jgi:hypothetical protein
MGPRPRALAIGAVLLVATVGLVWVARSRHEAGVLVVGDSMAVLASRDLRAEGDARGLAVTVDAQIGISLAARLGRLRDAAASHVQRLVVELGSNDVLQHTPTATLDGLVDDAVTTVEAISCVVFVNVGILDDPDGLAAHFNAHLHDDLALHHNEHEYDWSTDYRLHPEWTDDTVHLQPSYWPLYAHGIIDTLAHACP